VTTDAAVDDATRQQVQSAAEELIRKQYDKIWNGDKDSLSQLPVESLAPILILKHMSALATFMDLAPDHIEVGYDPELGFSRGKPSAKKQALLAEIDSQFSEGDFAFQFLIDANFINTYLLEFIMVEESFSLEKYLSYNPKTAPMAKAMNTRIFSTILPDIEKLYGAKRFDVMLSMSHTLIGQNLENAKITGFSLDKNGNFRVNLNLFAQVLVDTTGNKNWVMVREIYIGLTYKGKFVQKEKDGANYLLIVHKQAEVSGVKILDEKSEEMVVEQMMITSGLNVQFEQMLSKMPPKVFPLSAPASPEELDCLGFRLTEINVDFKKGYGELNYGYENVSNPRDPKKCEEFMNALRNGP
jgi:hypothetical protein